MLKMKLMCLSGKNIGAVRGKGEDLQKRSRNPARKSVETVGQDSTGW